MNCRNAVLDVANAPAEPTNYNAMYTEALRLMLGECHLQQTGLLSERSLVRTPAGPTLGVFK